MSATPEQLAAADDLRTQHRRAVAGVRSSQQIDSTEKRRRILELDDEARRQMAALEREAQADLTRRQRAGERDVFGVADLPGDPATLARSLRDAQAEVADLLTSRQAAAVFAQAEASGDEVRARAVAAHAFAMARNPFVGLDQGWLQLVNEFAAARPDKEDAVQALADTHGGAANVTDLFTYVIPTGGDAA